MKLKQYEKDLASLLAENPGLQSAFENESSTEQEKERIRQQKLMETRARSASKLAVRAVIVVQR